jgi:hypothetical protein
VLTEFFHLCASIESSLPFYRWIEKGGLELLPLGRDELIATIDWIERYADQPMDLADASLVIAALKTGCTRIDRWDALLRSFSNLRKIREARWILTFAGMTR